MSGRQRGTAGYTDDDSANSDSGTRDVTDKHFCGDSYESGDERSGKSASLVEPGLPGAMSTDSSDTTRQQLQEQKEFIATQSETVANEIRDTAKKLASARARARKFASEAASTRLLQNRR